VALKVMTAGCRADAATRERFVREARAAAALDHPNVVRVLDVDAAHSPPYLVMEHVDGVSLQAAVARYGTFAAGEAAAVGVQIAWGLRHAAAVGLVHRDIKPANVLVDRKGGVKVLDLGIARFEDDPSSGQIGMPTVLGTLDYIAPEQMMDSSNVDVRADLYALGSTLYFLLAGHPPFPDDDMARKAIRKQTIDPAPLAVLRHDVPDGLAAVVHKLLARAPAGRYQTPAEVADALAPWAEPAADFPDRLFRAWGPPSPAVPDRPTAADHDPDATPLPPTRRIHRAATERHAPQSGLPDDLDMTPVPEGGPKTARVVVAPAGSTPPSFACGQDVDECGEATVNLLAILNRKRSYRALWLYLATTVLIVAILTGMKHLAF
jgi:serine/threonine protein kinase